MEKKEEIGGLTFIEEVTYKIVGQDGQIVATPDEKEFNKKKSKEKS